MSNNVNNKNYQGLKIFKIPTLLRLILDDNFLHKQIYVLIRVDIIFNILKMKFCPSPYKNKTTDFDCIGQSLHYKVNIKYF